MKRGYVDTTEGQVHYLTEGSGEPLILLAQVPFSSDSYLEMLPLLAKSYRVIAMDTPGYGNSYVPPEGYRVEDYARSIVYFLAALNIEKTNIFGHHTGASLAAEVAVAYPERVDKLVLSGCPCYAPEARKVHQSDPICRAREIKEDGSHLINWWQTCRAGLPYLEPEAWQRILREYLRADLGKKAESAHEALYSYDTEQRLPLIKCPTLLIYGTGDSFYNRLEATRKLISRCRIKIIEDSCNVPAWEKPFELSQAITQFLEDPVV